MSPTVCQQILTALDVISGADGTNLGETKLNDIRSNANFFRQGLIDLGLEVYGDFDSPIIPVMLYNPTKIAAFSRECYKRKLAVVVVGFPATPLVLSRARFCISAGHKKADLEKALVQIEEVADVLKLRYRNSAMG
jgi:serine palmitoyltransferase